MSFKTPEVQIGVQKADRAGAVVAVGAEATIFVTFDRLISIANHS